MEVARRRFCCCSNAARDVFFFFCRRGKITGHVIHGGTTTRGRRVLREAEERTRRVREEKISDELCFCV